MKTPTQPAVAMPGQANGHNVEQMLAGLRRRHLAHNHRRAQTALDVPASAWLWRACDREQAERVLELGSGFSSWALRSWQAKAKRARERTPVAAPQVWTIDDEAKWLATTRIELTELGLDTTNLWSLARLIECGFANAFDVVFVDLDSAATRVKYVGEIVQWAKPGGLIVLDDWHMPHYRAPMTLALASRGMHVFDVPETTDEWGRYLAWTRKPA